MVTMIGVCGGSRVGKSTIVEEVSGLSDQVAVVYFDFFCRRRSARKVMGLEWNFDLLKSYDDQKFMQVLLQLKAGNGAWMPAWSYKDGDQITPHGTWLDPVKTSIFLVDGFLLMSVPGIMEVLDELWYVYTSNTDIMFKRKMTLDTLPEDQGGRGYEPGFVREQWLNETLPGFIENIEPLQDKADRSIRNDDIRMTNPFANKPGTLAEGTLTALRYLQVDLGLLSVTPRVSQKVQIVDSAVQAFL